jgi:hypothetical protein
MADKGMFGLPPSLSGIDAAKWSTPKRIAGSTTAMQNTLSNFNLDTGKIPSVSAPSTGAAADAMSGLETVTITSKKIKPISASVLPNILDDYDMYTYHFRLYMVSDQATINRDFGPTSKSKKVIIAESGATTIGIDDVKIESIIGFTKQTGSTASTRFSFTLMQPFGATLLDYIAAAGRELNIQNFTKAPFYLELSFRARNPNAPGTKNTSIDDSISNLVWVWPLMITKTAISVNSGGSIYAVEAVYNGNLAYTNQAADLEMPVSVDATTVEEFFQGLKEALETKEAQKTVNKEVLHDVYEFYIDEDIAKERIPPDNPDAVADRVAQFLENGDKTTIHFQPGISLDRIVESILASTEKFQKSVKGTEEKDTLTKPDNDEEKSISQILPRVVADSQVIGWDTGRRDYARKYRYLITTYDMRTLQTPANEGAKVSSQRRYELLRERGRLKKIYQYLYTGRNDQVLDFDLTFNFNWYAALPLQAGIYTNFSTNEPGAVDNPNDSADNKASVEATGKPLSANIETQAAEDAAQQAAAPGFDIRNYAGSFGSNLSAPFKSNFSADINNGSADLIGDDQIAANLQDISSVATGITSSAISGFQQAQNAGRGALSKGLNFEQVDPAVEDLYSGEKNVNPLVVSYIESTAAINEDLTANAVSTPGRTMLSALFEQAKSPTSADLLNIDLQIKGDPYWLEPAPVGRSEGFLSALDLELKKRGLDPKSTTTGAVPTTPEDTETETLDAATSQVFILFRCFTPQNFDPESGITPKFTDSNVLNGFYGVRTVQHEFSQGKFTQTLSAIRDPQINVAEVDFSDIDDPSFKSGPPKDPVQGNTMNLPDPRGDIPSASEIAGVVKDKNLQNIAGMEPPPIAMDNGATLARKAMDKLKSAKEHTVSFLKDVYDGDNRNG